MEPKAKLCPALPVDIDMGEHARALAGTHEQDATLISDEMCI